MKFWLIVFFLTPEGEFVSKREIAYKDETSCYVAMNHVHRPQNAKKATIIRAVCVSDDHYMGRKQDEGIEYD